MIFYCIQASRTIQAETIFIEFSPDECRYFYDVLQLSSDTGEMLLVPMHAYPVMRPMNRELLPRAIDFGACALHDQITHAIELVCATPVAFQYQISVLRSDPQFELLTPKSGIIPGDGSVSLRIKYCPVIVGTSIMQILVQVSQPDREPHLLNVMGNAVSGELRRRVLVSAGAANEKPTPESILEPRCGDESKIHQKCVSIQWQGQTVSKGIHANEEYVTEGLRIPRRLHAGDQQGTNYVLTQHPGKLKPKYFKQAVDAQRARRAEGHGEQIAVRALAFSTISSIGALTVHSICADAAAKLREQTNVLTPNSSNERASHLKEIAFLQDLCDVQHVEKEHEFKGSLEFLGEPLLTVKELDIIQRKRIGVNMKFDKSWRSELRRATTIIFLGPTDGNSKLDRHVVSPRDAGTSITNNLPPLFNVLAQEIWRKRAVTLQKLIRQISKMVLRARSAKRLINVNIRPDSAERENEVDCPLLHLQTSVQIEDIKRNTATIQSFQFALRDIDDPNLSTNRAANNMRIINAILLDLSLTSAPNIDHFDIWNSIFPRLEGTTANLRDLITSDTPRLDKGGTEFEDAVPCSSQNTRSNSLSLQYKPSKPPQFHCHVFTCTNVYLRQGSKDEYAVRSAQQSEIPSLCKPNILSLSYEIKASAGSPCVVGRTVFIDAILGKTIPIDNSLFLGCIKGDIPLQALPCIDEASFAWSLRPRPVMRKRNVDMRIASTRWAATTSAYPLDWATTFDSWRPRQERFASGLKCLSGQYQLCSWALEFAMPRPPAGPNPEDDLSDSESEDECAYDQPNLVVEEGKLVLADSLQMNKDDSRQDSTRRHNLPYLGEFNDYPTVVSDIPRDRGHLSLSRAARNHRVTANSILGSRMCNIATQVDCPVHRSQLSSRGCAGYLPIEYLPIEQQTDSDCGAN